MKEYIVPSLVTLFVGVVSITLFKQEASYIELTILIFVLSNR